MRLLAGAPGLACSPTSLWRSSTTISLSIARQSLAAAPVVAEAIESAAAKPARRPLPEHLPREEIGRKNYLFAGSDRGAERAATLYTLIETAKLNGADPEAYLRDVIGRIADHPARRVADLLPWNWSPVSVAQAA
jgi:hypothetical protein